jgi:ankyrin repeat protein
MGPDQGSGTNILYTTAVSSIFDGYQKIADVILDKTSLELDAQGSTGNTLLMWSAYFGKIDSVKALIARGANVNLVNNEGDTAITLAAKRGFREIVSILKAYRGY